MSMCVLPCKINQPTLFGVRAIPAPKAITSNRVGAMKLFRGKNQAPNQEYPQTVRRRVLRDPDGGSQIRNRGTAAEPVTREQVASLHPTQPPESQDRPPRD